MLEDFFDIDDDFFDDYFLVERVFFVVLLDLLVDFFELTPFFCDFFFELDFFF